MPKCDLLTAIQYFELLSFPVLEEREVHQHYLLSFDDLARVLVKRQPESQLGFALQLTAPKRNLLIAGRNSSFYLTRLWRSWRFMQCMPSETRGVPTSRRGMVATHPAAPHPSSTPTGGPHAQPARHRLPLLRSHYPRVVLERDYTPTSGELVFVCTSSNGKTSRLALLTLLKTVQRLGYFPLLSEIPVSLPRFLAGFLGYEVFSPFTGADDRAGSRRRQLERLRTYLKVRPLDSAGRVWLEGILGEAAHLREDLVDLVNIALEELVRKRFELPAFSTLLELAQKARLSVNAGLHKAVLEILSEKDRLSLESLWTVDEAQSSPWNALRADPGKLSKTTVDAAIVRFHAMKGLPTPRLEGVLSSLKRDQFAEEARSLDAWQMRRLDRGKALSLAAVLVLEFPGPSPSGSVPGPTHSTLPRAPLLCLPEHRFVVHRDHTLLPLLVAPDQSVDALVVELQQLERLILQGIAHRR